MSEGQSGRRYRRAAVVLAVVAGALMLLRDAAGAAAAVSAGLRLCAETMIPALFPFMVVSELMVRTSAGRTLAAGGAVVLRPLFGVSRQGACALMMGWLCGFPVGAKTAAAYYHRGELSAHELAYLLCFCHVPSSAYLVGAVGISLFGCRSFGVALVVLTLLSSLLIGLLFRRSLPRRGAAVADGSQPLPEAGGGAALPMAITSAAESMLGVCATVVLFGVGIGILTPYLQALGLGDVVRTIISGALEMTAGVRAAASMSEMTVAAVLCAAAVGWGGLSVHCQILAVCDGCPVRMGAFWAARALSGLLCAGGMWLWLRLGLLSEATAIVPSQGGAVTDNAPIRAWSLACTAVLLAAVGYRLWRRTKERRGMESVEGMREQA